MVLMEPLELWLRQLQEALLTRWLACVPSRLCFFDCVDTSVIIPVKASDMHVAPFWSVDLLTMNTICDNTLSVTGHGCKHGYEAASADSHEYRHHSGRDDDT